MYYFSSYLLLLLFLNDHINVQATLSPTHQRLASVFCYIHDYSNWLEQETNLNYLLQFAQLFDLDTKRIEAELERYRLQHECLRVLEHLPLIFGSG